MTTQLVKLQLMTILITRTGHFVLIQCCYVTLYGYVVHPKPQSGRLKHTVNEQTRQRKIVRLHFCLCSSPPNSFTIRAMHARLQNHIAFSGVILEIFPPISP